MSCPSRNFHASSFLRRQDLYHDLGLTRNATQDEIKRAYRELALKLHPDVSQEDTSEQFSRVTTAYEILSDVRSREQYDSESRVGGFRSDHFVNMRNARETVYSPAGYAAAARNKNRTVNPSHFNMKEWEEWHYGKESDQKPSVATKNWMKMQHNAHQDYFRKKMARKVDKEREDADRRYNNGNDDDEEDRFYERGGPVSASVASENLRRQREARRERGGPSDADGCVIS
jgi:curved DNA-binding protein CbpA